MSEKTKRAGRTGAAAPPPAPPEDARARLLRAATDLFQARGYAAATVREIVEAAGVTKPVLYYYFENKEGLYLALMRSAMEEFEALIEAHSARTGPARARIGSLCEEALALFKRHLPAVRIMYSIYYGPPQGAPFLDFDRLHLAFQNHLKRLLVEGREAGEFRFGRTEDAMWAIIGVLNVAQEVELCHPEMALGTMDLRRILGLVLDALSARKPTDMKRHAQTKRLKNKGVKP
ncbi:MAG: TetR/AcrR family transcriptional regulator [Acidobacteriota bacterium]